MWSELIRTPGRMDWMLWPRLLALAERSWHRASWETIDLLSKRLTVRKEDWMNFSNAVGYKELRRLEELGVNYYLPRPGARYESKICTTVGGCRRKSVLRRFFELCVLQH